MKAVNILIIYTLYYSFMDLGSFRFISTNVFITSDFPTTYRPYFFIDISLS